MQYCTLEFDVDTVNVIRLGHRLNNNGRPQLREGEWYGAKDSFDWHDTRLLNTTSFLSTFHPLCGRLSRELGAYMCVYISSVLGVRNSEMRKAIPMSLGQITIPRT